MNDFKDVKFSLVDGNSELILEGEDCFIIEKMKDDASLRLNKGRIGTAWAEVNKVEGENVKFLLSPETRLTINREASVLVFSENLNSNSTDYARATGRNLHIKG